MTEMAESERSSLAVSGAEAPPPAGRTALSDRLPRAWMFPLLASAAAWVLILAAWNIAGAMYGPMSWERYFSYKDSLAYSDLARFGYGFANPAVPHSDPAGDVPDRQCDRGRADRADPGRRRIGGRGVGAGQRRLRPPRCRQGGPAVLRVPGRLRARGDVL